MTVWEQDHLWGPWMSGVDIEGDYQQKTCEPDAAES